MRLLALIALLAALSSPAYAGELTLEALTAEALKKSPVVKAAEARVRASERRVPQSRALSDPMLMTGYQDEGWGKTNYGESPDAQIMLGLSQMFPYPGKRDVKEEMAVAEAQAAAAAADETRLRTIERVRDLYMDLYSSYRTLDVIMQMQSYFTRLEDAALARYSAGRSMQQEVLMAQKEKYMLREREAMLRERIGTTEAMLSAAVGRSADEPQVQGRPDEPPYGTLMPDAVSYVREHLSRAPMVKEKEAMLRAAEAKVGMNEKEYFPDFTISANYSFRGEPMENMWSLTGTINLPVWRESKLDPAVEEAKASVEAARAELESTKLMLGSTIREGLVMARSAESLMALYKDSFIPKTRQDFEAALSQYSTGGGQAASAVAALRGLFEAETQYWQQYAARQKAAVKIEASAGIMPHAESPAKEEK